MQLVQFNVKFEFDELTQLYTPARKVFNAFGGKTPKRPPREPGTSIRDEQSKLLVRWDYKGCRIALERTEKRDEVMNLIMRLLQVIDSAVPIGRIRKTYVTTSWILPAPHHDYTSLNKLYMRTIISQKDFMQYTYDSSVMFDSRIDEFAFHHQSGPMEPKQLLEDYLLFKRDKLPKVFIFLLTRLTNNKVIEYTKKEMRDFLEGALSHCERHSEQFDKLWEDSL